MSLPAKKLENATFRAVTLLTPSTGYVEEKGEALDLQIRNFLQRYSSVAVGIESRTYRRSEHPLEDGRVCILETEVLYLYLPK